MGRETKPWIVRLLVNASFTLIGFLLVNFFYVNEQYDLTAFLEDYPNFPYSSFPKIIIPIFFPIIFFIPVLLIENFLQHNSKVIKISLTILGQVIVSAMFFYVLWYLMFTAPEYPSLIDQEQATKGFFCFCVSAFLTVGIFASDGIRELVEDFIIKFMPKK